MERSDNNCHRYEVFLPKKLVSILDQAARKNRSSVSLILREILSNPDKKTIPKNLKRPKKFTEPVHRFPVLMYGDDKALWKIRLASHSCEFGAYLRFLVDLYFDQIEIIAKYGSLIAECQNLEVKFIPFLNRIRSGYQFLISYQPFLRYSTNGQKNKLNNILNL